MRVDEMSESPIPRFASRGRAYVYVLPCRDEDLLKVGFSRDPQNYAVALFGKPNAGAPSAAGAAALPAAEAWGWRIEGHHLSLHFTLLGDRYLSTLPQFMGANPALVPHDIAKGGPQQGVRVLAQEEDLARQLLDALGPEQRKACVFERRTYGDIVSKNAAQLSPLSPVGVRWADLPARCCWHCLP